MNLLSRQILCLVAGLFSVLWLSSELAADDMPPELKVGLGGVAKLGHWSPVQFRVGTGIASQATQFRIRVIDGDETPVTTCGPVVKSQRGVQGLVQLGRAYGEATFELLAGEEVVLSEQANIGERGNRFVELLPSTARVYASLEPERAATESMADCLASAFPGGVSEDDRVVSLTDPGQFPSLALAWEGCETVVISLKDKDWLARMTPAAIDAIDSYVRRGGHLVLAVNPNCAELLQEGGALQRFAGRGAGSVGASLELGSSRRLAEFCNSSSSFLDRDETMKVMDLKGLQGRVALQQGDQPLVLRRSHGIGEVTLIAFDPTAEQFRDWKAGKAFMQSLMRLRFGEESPQASSNMRSGTSVRHAGYKDLVGQMKVPLERFNELRFIRFELIALLIALYVICIGVGDWFLVGKVFKRHALTWITFPLLAALFCGIAWFAASGSRPATTQLNQIELIDIDSVSGDTRATVWGNVYSPTGETVDLRLSVNPQAAKRSLKLDSSQLTWLGLPGEGLGGMLNRANPGLYRTGYQQTLRFAEADLGAAVDVNIDMQDLKLQVSSTRPLLGKWNGKFEKSISSRLRSENGRLEGTFINPFDVPLRNCALFFNDRVYLIEGTFPVDDDIDIQSGTTEKTIRSFLTRRASRVGDDDQNKSQSVAWDPKSVDLTRIMQMMMFFHGSGGVGYTGLTHSYHDFIEMTPQCSLNRAILVGRISDRVSSIEFNGENADDLYDSSLSFVRVLLPVETGSENPKRKR